MRVLDPGFAAHIADGQTNLCHCWRIIRGDGTVLGFTDHDLTVSFDGTEFEPANGLESSDTVAKLGAGVDTSEVLGILHSDAIAEEDIVLGRYDGATVESWQVNWRDSSQRFLVSRDSIGEIIREDGIFRAELRSQQHALNVPGGRHYDSQCGARLGDAACGIDLEAPAYTGPATVVSIQGRYRLEVSGLAGFGEGWFEHGSFLWTNGKRSGLLDQISGQATGDSGIVLSFTVPAGDWAVPGDAGSARAGCDRRFSTCGAKFANQVNFRGFPHIPGNDFVLRYPKEGRALNGQALVK